MPDERQTALIRYARERTAILKRERYSWGLLQGFWEDQPDEVTTFCFPSPSVTKLGKSRCLDFGRTSVRFFRRAISR